MKFSMLRDINGVNGFGINFSDDKFSTTLVANVVQTITIPTLPPDQFAWLVIFYQEPGSSVWVAKNEVPVVPGASFARTTAEGNPVARVVNPGDVLQFITNNDSVECGFILYSLYSKA